MTHRDADRSEAVLDVAEALFGEKSYEAVTIDEIAERTDLSVATLYGLFEGKRAIYKAVIGRAHHRFAVGLDAALQSARGPLDVLRTVVRYYLAHFEKYQQHFRFFLAAGGPADAGVRAEIESEARDQQRALLTYLASVCQLGVDQGVFARGLPAEHMALVVLSIPNSVLTYWLDHQDLPLESLVTPALRLVDRLLGADRG